MSYYDDLGVSRTATKEEITSAYRKLQKQYHPDVYKGSDPEEASNKVKAANAAYDVLGDEYKRSEYDRKLDAGAFDNDFQSNSYGNQGNPYGDSYANQGNPYGNPYANRDNPYASRQSSGFYYYNPFSDQSQNVNQNPFESHHYTKRRSVRRMGSFGRIVLRLVVWYALFRFISVFARVSLPFFFFF